MADFPAIEPTGRSYDFGTFSMSEAGSVCGSTVRFNHSSTAVGFKLTLSFSDLNETDADTLRAHYADQQGGYRSFRLSSAVWAGQPDPEFLAPLTDRWIYDGPIDEGPVKPGGFYQLSVSLRHVGPEQGFP